MKNISETKIAYGVWRKSAYQKKESGNISGERRSVSIMAKKMINVKKISAASAKASIMAISINERRKSVIEEMTKMKQRQSAGIEIM